MLISPRPGMYPARGVGDLNVADAVDDLAERLDQVPFHHLHVIEVVLEAHVGQANRVDQRHPFRRAADEVAGIVVVVERLDQQDNSLIGGAGPGFLEPLHRDLELLCKGSIGIVLAGQHVDPPGAQPPRDPERFVEAIPEAIFGLRRREVAPGILRYPTRCRSRRRPDRTSSAVR